jgi:hypothetical protein
MPLDQVADYIERMEESWLDGSAPNDKATAFDHIRGDLTIAVGMLKMMHFMMTTQEPEITGANIHLPERLF